MITFKKLTLNINNHKIFYTISYNIACTIISKQIFAHSIVCDTKGWREHDMNIPQAMFHF